MLVYIRESDKEKIICNVDEKDIAEHLRVRCLFVNTELSSSNFCSFNRIVLSTLVIIFQIRLKKEQEEKEQKRKEKAEAHLYTIIKVRTSPSPSPPSLSSSLRGLLFP